MSDVPELRTYEQLLKEYAKERGPGSDPVVRLGFGSLDAEMRGISPGQVCGIAARTSVGKTWALNTIEYNCTARDDMSIVSLSLEMPGLEWAERALAVHQDVAPEQVEGWARSSELDRYTDVFLKRTRNVLLCEDPCQIGQLGALVARGREMTGVPVRLVMIDYLGLLGAPGRDTYERASAVARGLKQFAKASRVSVVVAMQLSRAAGDGSIPVTLDMLRDSGALEEAVDFLIGCWRPGRATDQPEEAQLALQDTMRVRLLKNRKGHDGREVDLTFRPESRRLVEQASPFDGL